MLAQLDGEPAKHTLSNRLTLQDIVNTAHPHVKGIISSLGNLTTISKVDRAIERLDDYWGSKKLPLSKADQLQLQKELTLLDAIRKRIITNSPKEREALRVSRISEPQEIGSWFKKLVKSVSKDVNKVEKEVANVATKTVNTVEHVVALVAAPVARLAAIELIKKNDLNLATMLAQAWQKDKNKVTAFWYDFGGSQTELLKAINQGAHTSLSGHYIGEVTAGNATATAIVNAIMDFLRELGIPIPPIVQQQVDKWIDQAADKLKKGATTLAKLSHDFNGQPPVAGVLDSSMKKQHDGGMPLLLLGGVGILTLIVLSNEN